MMIMMMILIKFNAYPNFLKHTFSVTGLSETWLNHSDIEDTIILKRSGQTRRWCWLICEPFLSESKLTSKKYL